MNRARALTVETVMNPPASRISAKTIGGALEQMKKLPDDYGYYVNDDGYQGILLQETLEQAAVRHSDAEVDLKLIEEIPVVAPDALLETVIPETLDSDYDLPVVNEKGTLQGELSRTNLAEVLGASVESNASAELAIQE